MFCDIFAWEGAIALARLEDAGRFGSHRFLIDQLVGVYDKLDADLRAPIPLKLVWTLASEEA